MFSRNALAILNALSAQVGSREALRLFTSPLKKDGERANRILAGLTCGSGGDCHSAGAAGGEKASADQAA